MENSFQERTITLPSLFSFDPVNAPGRPRDNGRINIAKIPLVCGYLAVRMLVPFARNEIELTLRKVRIDQRKRNAMKGKVPGCIPWSFRLSGIDSTRSL
jgi:hypothetical protein